MNKDERKHLLAAIRRANLSDAKLIVLLLTALGWTQEEIGAVLDLDQRTVSWHWNDATERLRAVWPTVAKGE